MISRIKLLHLEVNLNKIVIESPRDNSEEEEKNEEIKIPEFPNEESIKWNHSEWQVKVLKPFLDSIVSQPYESEQLKILEYLHDIIDDSFEELNDYGWKVIVATLKSLDFSKISEDVYKQAYKIVDLLAWDYIDFIEAKTLKLLISSVKKYAGYQQGRLEFEDGSSKKEICCKSSKIYLGIAKSLANKQTEHDERVEERMKKDFADQATTFFNGPDEMESLWKVLFSEIKLLFSSTQHSIVIRKSTVEALKSITCLVPESYSSILWEYIISTVLLGMFDRSVSKYIDQLVGFTTTKAREVKQHEISQSLQTPTFSFGPPPSETSGGKKVAKKGQGRRMQFNDEIINKFHQRDSEQNAPQHTGFGAAPEETPKTQKPSQESLDDQSICLFMIKIVNDSLLEFRDLFVESKPRCHKTVAELWVKYSKIMNMLISNASADILKGILETLYFMLSTNLSEYIFKKYDSITLGIFEEINSLINRKTDLVLTNDVSVLLVDIYKKIFTAENIQDKPNLLNPQNLNVNLHILRVNLIHARPTMGLNAMRHDNDLKNEEKLIFDFIEFLGKLINDNEEALKYYLSFILNFINYDANEPHYEMFIRRAFDILSIGVIKDQYSPLILYDLLPELYTKTREIVNLRYHNNSWMSLVFSMKNAASLFETAGMFLLQISAHILDKENEEEEAPKADPGFIKPKLSIMIPNEGEAGEEDYSANVEENDSDDENHQEPKSMNKDLSQELVAIDEEDSILLSPSKFKTQQITYHTVQELILNKIMALLNDTLLFDISKIEKHNKAVKDSVIKSSQDLDVQVINFIINDLLPHSNKLGKQFERTLVSIIDKGCNGYIDAMSTPGINMFGSSSTIIAQSNSLSTYCLENLFQLCDYRWFEKSTAKDFNPKTTKTKNYLEESKEETKENPKKASKDKLEEIRKKIAKTTTPILLERCKDTLTKFLDDELKSGS